MLMLVVIFALIAYVEFRYLKLHNRKRKTYIKVFALLAFVFMYSVLLSLSPLPSLTKWVSAVLQSLA
ncbi:hypothetical protein FHS18_004640 [Paenibacillus phyllosphaerae]|uniref:Uncharacterized protein n=1 Tax=Paenibacillus phyllosphaerae TaxID=274593 RepID=A0A7W5B1S9_9BACL|nr:hypothetical protein [Paenibacillus phyllosphaerae]MBB3112539.1 hypothetical protein [Paenibacillus phyllosphaerae]